MRLISSAAYRWQTNTFVSWRTEGTSPVAGIPLPPTWMRQGGEHFSSNSEFVSSGVCEARFLKTECGLSPDTKMMEVGCGAGRLAIGQMESGILPATYVGLEVQTRHVAWCRRKLTARDSRFRFVSVDAANERYNPEGTSDCSYPAADETIDLVYAYSVLSHMPASEVRCQLGEIARVLTPTGSAIVTAFIEPDVADETVNPSGPGHSWVGPLHCVRYRQEFFEEMAKEAGLAISWVDRGVATDGQSRLQLVRQ